MVNRKSDKLFYQGKYVPTNPKKYIGNVDNIVYRSSWELRVMKWLDNNDNIISWASEEFAIPYLSPTDDRLHRYFPDFIVKMKTPNGIRTVVFEVKPKDQIVPSKRLTGAKRLSKKMLKEAMTIAVNNAKFEAAKKFCEERDWKFEIITEADLFNG